MANNKRRFVFNGYRSISIQIMDTETYKILIEDAGVDQRMDIYLSKNFPKPTSRTFVQRLIKAGHIKVNGVRADNHYRLKKGDVLDIALPQPIQDSDIMPEDIPLDIVFEDEDVIIVNKKSGMVVHPASGVYSGTLVNALLHHCGKLSNVNLPTRPGVVHRLDKDVSGLLVVAKNDFAHRELAKQFKNRTITRKYLALVRDVVEFDEGTVDVPIGRDLRDRKKMAVRVADGKEAITKYKVKKRFKDRTFLEITLGTGRTHQIRVHMAHIGHPVLGDSVYNKWSDYKRIALHAATIGFLHPKTKKVMEFSSELPEDLKPLLIN